MCETLSHIAFSLCYSDAIAAMDKLTSDSHDVDRHERETDIDERWAINSEASTLPFHPPTWCDDAVTCPPITPCHGSVMLMTREEVDGAELPCMASEEGGG